ncbi:MAG: glycine betaine/L-proline ABC transporter substrate-binding protein ProX [Alphaproteobacteria bacterium]
MKLTKKIIFAASIVVTLGVTNSFADVLKPGKGVSIQPARANWNTGYFQEALARKGLEELGYKVKKAKELSVPLFYQSVVLGDVDFWANGWFPTHNTQMSKDFAQKAEAIGYIVKNGGLQGYAISKKYAEELNIKSLDDFKRDEVKKAFDSNGDGKADLVGCPAGWNCEMTIAHHMKTYGLENDINVIKSSYNAAIADALARHKQGKAIAIYTWTPSWMVYKLKPGEDVVWINVPKIEPTEAQKGSEALMSVENIEGAVTAKVDLGFVVSDIRVVGNKKFLNKNPAAAKFLSLITLPLQDINEQNTRMEDGESSAKDIQNHVNMWIEKNQETWNSWLTQARNAAK